jgi:glycosyltransferase involved in cell wall biosynthesis
MMPEYDISLVIPAYNEEEGIKEALDTSGVVLQKTARNYEIIVVDDGSIDRTGEIVDRCAECDGRIRPIHNVRNEGSGRSLFTGLKNARYDFVATNFADLPFDMGELGGLLALFSGGAADFVVVSRKNRKANSFYRKITSLVNYWLIRLLFGVRIGDFQFVQVYRKKVLDAVDVGSNGTFVPPEIIIKAIGMGFIMRQYRADFHPRKAGSSKCGSPGVVIETLRDMFRFWFYWVILKKGRKA